MRAELVRHPAVSLRVIGIDELSISRGHTYRVIVSDVERGRVIWVGGAGRTEADLARFFADLGAPRVKRIRLAVLDMWKPFRLSVQKNVPQAALLYDKFHILQHLGKALDEVRRMEYKRVAGKEREFIKGQRYTLFSHKENLNLEGGKALKKLLAANKRLNTA